MSPDAPKTAPLMRGPARTGPRPAPPDGPPGCAREASPCLTLLPTAWDSRPSPTSPGEEGLLTQASGPPTVPGGTRGPERPRLWAAGDSAVADTQPVLLQAPVRTFPPDGTEPSPWPLRTVSHEHNGSARGIGLHCAPASSPPRVSRGSGGLTGVLPVSARASALTSSPTARGLHSAGPITLWSGPRWRRWPGGRGAEL